jgi:general secretion pathway protein G
MVSGDETPRIHADRIAGGDGHHRDLAQRGAASVDRSKEATLKQSLSVMRDAIDQFYSDQGRYPDTLGELQERRYVRAIPVDPVTGSTESWIVVAPPPGPDVKGAVYDVKSGAEGKATGGTEFSNF